MIVYLICNLLPITILLQYKLYKFLISNLIVELNLSINHILNLLFMKNLIYIQLMSINHNEHSLQILDHFKRLLNTSDCFKAHSSLKYNFMIYSLL